MATKRKVFLHVGLHDVAGEVIDLAIDHHRDALVELGVTALGESRDEMFRASLEMLGDHKTWGYRRGEVEGVWSRIVRRSLKGRHTLVASQPLLASATPDQAALVVDALAGFQVHVVVTVAAPDAWAMPGDQARDLGTVLARWGSVVSKPERLHVIVAVDPDQAWTDFGRVVGFGTASLAAPAAPPHRDPMPVGARVHVLRALAESWVEILTTTAHDVVGEPDALRLPNLALSTSPEDVARRTEHALTDALAEVERLSRRNESLEAELDRSERKRRKARARLSSVA
ncbi:hypothetical protein [Nocardioides sp. R-C-SC26]|uniref:hypothetical protein n=1 Tax=Nocardioides sp. R-C-SC26 TaxID=2870414 RepID=UPI001E3FAE89|nr:hypothetical protein [Nocardioides sp. R-C-SC26]